MPAVMPAIAPRAVPRRQIRPPKNAGANCAMAANDNRPIEASCAVAGGAVIDVGEKQDGEDRDAPHRQKLRAGVARPAAVARAALERQTASTMSFDTMMASATDFHDHHRGRGREAADEGDEREQFGMRRQRQRQHEHVAVDAAGRERSAARPSRSAPRTD